MVGSLSRRLRSSAAVALSAPASLDLPTAPTHSLDAYKVTPAAEGGANS